MPLDQPPTISQRELLRRQNLVRKLASELGFHGQVEYRHIYSQSGGAQFGLGPRIGSDVLIVYAEAFLRDATPDDFSLNAILAHECGHQLVFRHPKLSRWLRGKISLLSEEALASLVGSLLVSNVDDHNALTMKAICDAMDRGAEQSRAEEVILKMRSVLEAIL